MEQFPRVPIDLEIECIDCGGMCWLVTVLDPDDPPAARDIVVYRCKVCGEPWYVEVGEDQA